MRNFLIIIIILQSSIQGSAQNLVQNPEFNEVFSGQYSGVSGNGPFNVPNWSNPLATDSSEYWGVGRSHYHACGNIVNTTGSCPGQFTATLPNSATYFYVPKPYAALGLAGQLRLIRFNTVFWKNNPFSPFSYPRNELETPLLEDTTYCTEIHVWLSEGKESGNRKTLTHDGLGMYFTQQGNLPSNRPWQNNIVPHVSGWGYITNTTEWRKLKGSFKADGGEEYLFLGNFAPYVSPIQLLKPLDPNHDSSAYEGAIFFDAVYVYNCRDTLFSILQEDTTVCYGQQTWLAPELRGFKLRDSITTYHWETPMGNFTTQDTGILATQPGSYKVQAVINKRFKSQTTFNVHWLPEPPDSGLVADTLIICLNQNEVKVEVPYIFGADYVWPNGDTTRAQTFTWPGEYLLQVSTKCWLHEETVYVEKKNCGNALYVPNAFTPDGDGVNDYFEIYGTDKPIHITITDRWGRVVLSSKNYQNDWDGTYNGQPLEQGVYTYVIFWSKDDVVTGRKMGTVTILR